jgi:nucleoid-associated protein YgaU
MNNIKSIAAALALTCIVAAGCSQNKPSPDAVAANNSVTDINAAPAPAPAPAAPVATTPQPVIYDTAPAPEVIAIATPTTPSHGGRYTVQRGDTLWKIATQQYNDGKQWQRIAAANPGLSPETLKAGQTITLP